MGKWKWQVALIAAFALSACGGGGGGGSTNTGGDGGIKPTATELQGTVAFESVPVNGKAGLDFANRTMKPARGLRVEVFDANDTFLGKTTTDAAGHYTVSLKAQTVAYVRVYASMARYAGPARWEASVLDNTRNYILYGVNSPPVTLAGGAKTVDISIPSGLTAADFSDGPTVERTDPRPAAPFAILDTVYDNQAKVIAALPEAVLPPLYLLWSPKNVRSVEIDHAKGHMAGTAFWAIENDSFISLMGKLGSDTDEYDTTVISHEWAHYLQHALSRDDSVGGAHAAGDLLDRTVAFGEGLGNAWAGIATGLGTYVDTIGPAGTEPITAELAAAPTTNPGWYNEDSVRYALWKLHEAVGPGPMLKALTGPMRTSVAPTAIHSFNAALAAVSPDAAARFAPLLLSQSIQPRADAWGLGETNSGGSPLALPMVRQLQRGAPLPDVCVSRQFDPKYWNNRLGNIAYLRFSVDAPGMYRISATAPSNSVPALRIRDARGPVLIVPEISASSQSLNAFLFPGEYALAVSERNLLVAQTCFTVSIQ